MTENTQRDDQIIKQYQAGESMRTLAKMHDVSRSRIQQIIRAAGVPTHRQSRKRIDPPSFLGVSLPETAKKALRAEANRRGVSMSSLSSSTIKEMLIAAGYPIKEDPKESQR